MTEKHRTVLEPRAYGPDCTDAEREAIISRVSLFSPDTILLREAPVPNKFQTDLIFDEVERLSKSMSTIYALVDLTESQRPNAEVRQYLRERIGRLKEVKYVALYTGKNFFNNITAQFVLGHTTFYAFSVHKTQEEALRAIQKVRDAATNQS